MGQAVLLSGEFSSSPLSSIKPGSQYKWPDFVLRPPDCLRRKSKVHPTDEVAMETANCLMKTVLAAEHAVDFLPDHREKCVVSLSIKIFSL